MSKRSLVEELRGATQLAVEATRAVTDLVQAMHVAIAGGPDVLGRPLARVAKIYTAPVYGTIRGVTGLVGAGIDLALGQLAPLLSGTITRPEREHVLAVLNGVLGAYLLESGNPLAIEMRLRQGGQPLALDGLETQLGPVTGKLLVLVHGSSMNDRQWTRLGHDHGAALARDLGFTPIYLHYNSGLHVSTNGRTSAALLEALIAAWPVPLEKLAIVAHSMGGLVARSACEVGEAAGHTWRRHLHALVCLGTPHHGAPLERGGNWLNVLLDVSHYSAPVASLARIRSAGITDMRFGSVRDDDWIGRDRFELSDDPRTAMALPEGVRCYAVAGTSAVEPGDDPPGDGVVPVASALGRHPDPKMQLAFPASHQWIAAGTRHLDLLSRLEVYERVRSWLA